MRGNPYGIWPVIIDGVGDYTIQNVTNTLGLISKEAANALSSGQNYLTSPMGVSLVNASEMPLSMMQGSKSCRIELDMAYGTPKGFETLEK